MAISWKQSSGEDRKEQWEPSLCSEKQVAISHTPTPVIKGNSHTIRPQPPKGTEPLGQYCPGTCSLSCCVSSQAVLRETDQTPPCCSGPQSLGTGLTHGTTKSAGCSLPSVTQRQAEGLETLNGLLLCIQVSCSQCGFCTGARAALMEQLSVSAQSWAMADTWETGGSAAISRKGRRESQLTTDLGSSWAPFSI